MCVIFHAAIENSRRLIQIENQSHVLEVSNSFFILLMNNCYLMQIYYSNSNQIYMRINQSRAWDFHVQIFYWFANDSWSDTESYEHQMHFPFLHTQKFNFFSSFSSRTQLTLINYSCKLILRKGWTQKNKKNEMKKKNCTSWSLFFWDFIFHLLIDGRVRCLINLVFNTFLFGVNDGHCKTKKKEIEKLVEFQLNRKGNCDVSM